MSEFRRKLMAAQGGGGSIIDGYEYVDLGLPSGTLWATMNVGASTICDVGLYFRWGETTGYAIGNTSGYVFGNNNNPTKYNSTDGLTELELADDGVSANMGGGWTMPTYAQLTELVSSSNTSLQKVSNYQESGIGGYLYTSKYNGKTIFIPYCGEYIGANKYNGSRVYIWSKTLVTVPNRSGTIEDNGTSTKTEIRSYFVTLRGVYNI